MDKHKYIMNFCAVFVGFCTVVSAVGNSTSPKLDDLKADVMKDCFLETVNPKLGTNVGQMVLDGAKVIYIYFNFENFTGSLLKEDESFVYRPLSMVLTTGRHGRSLLLLRPQYEIFSLSSLSLGTKRVDVMIKQSPQNCLTDQNATVVAEELKKFLLYNFRTPTGNSSLDETLSDNEHICNLNISPMKGKAIFYYICCHKTSKGKTKCQELKSDKYITVLFVCIFAMNFFAVMFSPLLIPAKFYRKKYETTSYEHHLVESVALTVRKTSTKPKGQTFFPVSYFGEMNEFKKTVEGMHGDVTYNININKIDIFTETERLLPSNHVPVGLLESLHSAIINCEVRKKASIKDCCHSNILGPCKPRNRVFPWYKILRKFMHLLMYIFIGKVWIVRLHFFFEYEESERLQREEASTRRNLALPYTGNLTWYLTPVHKIFLICYCVFVVDVILFGILSKHVKATLKQVMRKCLRDMRELSKRSAFGWSMQILLLPFKRCGIFGILFAWLYYIPAIPVVIGTLAFYCLPTVNVLVRLLIYFVAYLLPYGKNCLTVRCCVRIKQCWHYIHKVFRMDILTKKESIERPQRISLKNRFLQLFVIFVCLLTIVSFVLLAMECIVFLVEVLMYTLIGVIINAAHTLKYISLAFLLIFYARDCFSAVTQEYLTFNKFLNGYVVDKMREKVEIISRNNHELQKNTAFQVSLEDKKGDDDKPVSLEFKENKLRWKVKRLILFLDKNDTPYITSKFFFDTCYLEQAGVPGPLMSSLMRAMKRFLIICVFLFFVVVVILAFGEEYGISATNQMFATLAGGFLPYILRFVLFKQPEPVTVDPDNLSFKNKFQRKIEEYSQSWRVADIRVVSKSTKGMMDSDNGDVALNADETKSNEKDVMLEEITPIMKNDTSEKVDILIYDKCIV